jgi:hypothetical protein
MGDIDSIKLNDIEKLIKGASLTKKDISDAIRDALTQSVLPVRDNTILVRSQVKAGDVQSASRQKTDSSSSSDKSGKSGGDLAWLDGMSKNKERGNFFLSFSESLEKLMGVLETATKRPLALIDMGVKSLAKGADRVFGGGLKRGRKDDSPDWESLGETGSGSRGGSESFDTGSRGGSQAGVVRSDVFGSIFRSGVPGFVSDDSQAGKPGFFPSSFFNAAPEPFSGPDVASAPSPVPDFGLGGDRESGPAPFTGILGFGRDSSGSVSTADNLSVDAMESDLRANDALLRTFEEPEKSDFGKFLDFQISGESGGNSKSKDKGLLGSLLEGVIFAGLLFALPFIVDNVIPFIKEDLVPFIKGPFLDFIKAAAPVISVAAGAAWTFVSRAFSSIGAWLDTNKEKIWGAVGAAADAISGWLGTYAWPAIEGAAKAIGGWLGANGKDIWDAITGAAGAVAGWLGANGKNIWDAIATAAVAIGTWVKEDGWPAFTGFLTSFGTFIKGTLGPFLSDVAAPTFVTNLLSAFGVVGDFFSLLSGKMGFSDFVTSLFTRVADTFSTNLSAARVAATSVATGKNSQATDQATLNFQISNIGARNVEGSSKLAFDPETGYVYRFDAGMFDPNLFALVHNSHALEKGLLNNYYTIKNLGEFSAAFGGMLKVGEVEGVNDAIITSEGQVIRTDPEDNIYAFKGDVSIAPANSVREFSGSSSGRDGGQSGSSTSVSNVTNNYINNSNFNLSDLLPGSEFDPVGV